MAMLAEPRQRKRGYNLAPRGKALYDDGDRFGTKMLEKMGWSKGKGLGAREDGSKDFVRVRYKNDIQGFGYEERDDQWTQHEEQFNGLLKALHESQPNSDQETESKEEEQRVGFGFKSEKKEKVKVAISGQSLEEKSKQSRARVHYKKFTRGKDLAQYSEKDLANIFGKKTLDEDQNPAPVPVFAVGPKEDSKPDPEQGVKIINSGKSLTDYFKEKMEALKRKREGDPQKEEKMEEGEQNGIVTEVDEEVKEENKKKKKKSKKSQVEDESDEPVRKRKKEAEVEIEVAENDVECITEISGKKKKKSKKDKKRKAEEIEEVVIVDSEVEENTVSKKKAELPEESVSVPETEKRKKKKKKSKNKEEDKVDEVIVIDETSEETPVSVEVSNEDSTDKTEESEDTWQVYTKKKKSKKDKHTPEDTKGTPSTNSPVDNPEGSSAVNTAISINANEPPTGEVDVVNNIYTVSSFCAEKFRNSVLSDFSGSNISQVVGYGLNSGMKLNVIKTHNCDEKITQFYTMDKTEEKPSALKNYYEKVKVARQEKKPVPKLNVKSFKRRHAFGCL